MKLRYLYPYIYLVRGDRPNPIVAELYPFDKLFIYLFGSSHLLYAGYLISMGDL